MSDAAVKKRLARLKTIWKTHLDERDDLELLAMLLSLRHDETMSTEAKQQIAHDVTQRLITKREGK
jgi:DNA-binding PadR family transcriptional regulator